MRRHKRYASSSLHGEATLVGASRDWWVSTGSRPGMLLLLASVLLLLSRPTTVGAAPQKFDCTNEEVYDQYGTSQPEILNGNCFNLRGENLNDATAPCSSSTERCWRQFRCNYVLCTTTRTSLCIQESVKKNYLDGICWQNYVSMNHNNWASFMGQGPRSLKRNFASDVAAVALDTDRGPALVVAGGRKTYTVGYFTHFQWAIEIGCKAYSFARGLLPWVLFRRLSWKSNGNQMARRALPPTPRRFAQWFPRSIALPFRCFTFPIKGKLQPTTIEWRSGTEKTKLPDKTLF